MSGADILIIALSEWCKILFREKRNWEIELTQASSEQWLTDIMDRNICWIVMYFIDILNYMKSFLIGGFFEVWISELKEWGSGGSAHVILISFIWLNNSK